MLKNKAITFYQKLRSGLSSESFLAFCNFEYSKFLNSSLTFSLIEQQAKQNMVLQLKTNNDTFNHVLI